VIGVHIVEDAESDHTPRVWSFRADAGADSAYVIWNGAKLAVVSRAPAQLPKHLDDRPKLDVLVSKRLAEGTQGL
jgi:hypothetical protein